MLGKIDDLEKAKTDEIHNLCSAINGLKRIHSLEYVKEVNKQFEAAVKAATKNGKVDKDLATQKIIEALGKMKEKLEEGKAFWPPHNKTRT